tara:strand:- start:36671 stop:37657 length:987 start_codon:yes stop_codon:yes gene_type:complete
MDLAQGSALPDVKTTQLSTTTTPGWYNDYLSSLAQTGQNAAAGAQFVGPTALQQQAYNTVGAAGSAYQPTLQAATNLAQTAGNTNLADLTQQMMTPYANNVVNTLGDLNQQNIVRNLSPQATAGIVGSGQFGSSRGAGALGQVINNANLATQAQQQQAMQTGYTQALQAAQNQVQNQLAAGQQLGNLATSNQALGLGNINALATLGGQQQQIAQQQQLFPLQTATAASGLLRGYNVPTSTSSTYQGPLPGAYAASPLQQISTLGSLLAALNASPASYSGAAGKTPLENIIGGISKLPWDKINPFSSSSTTSTNTSAGNTIGDYDFDFS